MKHSELKKKLKNFNCIELKKKNSGSHRKWYNPELEKSATIPFHAGKEIPIGTLRKFIQLLGIDWAEFNSYKKSR